MDLGLIGRAACMFAVTNVDDIVLLALFFGQAAGQRGAALRVVAGQYLGFAGILAASVVGALGAGLLPESAIPYLGLLPLALGLRAGWRAWRERHDADDDNEQHEDSSDRSGPGALAVAAVTLAGLRFMLRLALAVLRQGAADIHHVLEAALSSRRT
jgi:cadmium resistance protein CadD (predicted permease)